VASWVHRHLSVENVFRVAAASVFVMFFGVLVFFQGAAEIGRTWPRRAWRRRCATSGRLVANPKFMIFSADFFPDIGLFTWQEFITLPIYIHDYVDPKADTERMLSIGPLVVIAFTVTFSVLTQKISAFSGRCCWGTLVSMVAFAILAVHASIYAAYATLVVIAVGELIQQAAVLRLYFAAGAGGSAGGRTWALRFFFAAGDWNRFLAGRIGGALLHRFWRSAAPARKMFFVGR